MRRDACSRPELLGARVCPGYTSLSAIVDRNMGSVGSTGFDLHATGATYAHA